MYNYHSNNNHYKYALAQVPRVIHYRISRLNINIYKTYA